MGLFFSQASFSWRCCEQATLPLAFHHCDSLWRSLRGGKCPCGGKKTLQGNKEVVSHHSNWDLDGELPLISRGG